MARVDIARVETGRGIRTHRPPPGVALSSHVQEDCLHHGGDGHCEQRPGQPKQRHAGQQSKYDHHGMHVRRIAENLRIEQIGLQQVHAADPKKHRQPLAKGWASLGNFDFKKAS